MPNISFLPGIGKFGNEASKAFSVTERFHLVESNTCALITPNFRSVSGVKLLRIMFISRCCWLTTFPTIPARDDDGCTSRITCEKEPQS